MVLFFNDETNYLYYTERMNDDDDWLPLGNRLDFIPSFADLFIRWNEHEFGYIDPQWLLEILWHDWEKGFTDIVEYGASICVKRSAYSNHETSTDNTQTGNQSTTSKKKSLPILDIALYKGEADNIKEPHDLARPEASPSPSNQTIGHDKDTSKIKTRVLNSTIPSSIDGRIPIPPKNIRDSSGRLMANARSELHDIYTTLEDDYLDPDGHPSGADLVIRPRGILHPKYVINYLLWLFETNGGYSGSKKCEVRHPRTKGFTTLNSNPSKVRNLLILLESLRFCTIRMPPRFTLSFQDLKIPNASLNHHYSFGSLYTEGTFFSCTLGEAICKIINFSKRPDSLTGETGYPEGAELIRHVVTKQPSESFLAEIRKFKFKSSKDTANTKWGLDPDADPELARLLKDDTSYRVYYLLLEQPDVSLRETMKILGKTKGVIEPRWKSIRDHLS